MNIGFFGEIMLEYQADAAQPGFAGDTFNTALTLKRLALQHQLPLGVCYFTLLGQDDDSDRLHRWLEVEGLAGSADLPQAGVWQADAGLAGAELAGTESAGTESAGAELAETAWAGTVGRHPAKTLGRYWIQLDAHGERSFRYERADSAVRQYFAASSAGTTALEQALAQGQLQAFYLSGISLAILTEADRARLLRALQLFTGRGGLLIYDNNFRPALWDVATAARWQALLLPLCALVLLTDDDEQRIWQQPAADAAALLAQAAARCPGTVVLKCGAQPVLICGPAAAAHQAAAQATRWQLGVPATVLSQISDSSGAGDAFAAGFLAIWLTGCRPQFDASLAPQTDALLAQQADALLAQQAARAGHQLAGAVVQQHGALLAPALLPDLSALLSGLHVLLPEPTAQQQTMQQTGQQPGAGPA